MQYNLMHVEEGSDEALTKAQTVKEGRCKAVKKTECPQQSPAKSKKAKIGDADTLVSKESSASQTIRSVVNHGSLALCQTGDFDKGNCCSNGRVESQTTKSRMF